MIFQLQIALLNCQINLAVAESVVKVAVQFLKIAVVEIHLSEFLKISPIVSIVLFQPINSVVISVEDRHFVV